MPLGGGLTLASAGVSLIGGVGKTIFGGNELKKTRKELAGLNMPEYQVQPEYYQNERMAAQLAQGGIPQQAKDYFTSETERGLGSSLGSVLQTGGGINDISKMLDRYNQSVKGFAAEDAMRQVENMKYYQQTAKDLAGQKTMKWAINEYQPYQNKLKELTQRRAAAYQNLFGGIGDIAGSLGAAGTALQNTGLGQAGGGSNYVSPESNLQGSTSFRTVPTGGSSSPNVIGLINGLIPE